MFVAWLLKVAHDLAVRYRGTPSPPHLGRSISGGQRVGCVTCEKTSSIREAIDEDCDEFEIRMRWER